MMPVLKEKKSGGKNMVTCIMANANTHKVGITLGVGQD